MVKLRGFRFKSIYLDNAAAITIGFFVQEVLVIQYSGSQQDLSLEL